MEDLHDARLNFVIGSLLDCGVRNFIDLGCGAGSLLKKALLSGYFDAILGLETAADSLAVARAELADYLRAPNPELRLINGSGLDVQPQLQDFDAIVMVETLEHIDPRQLSRLEEALFVGYRPRHVILSTPNRDYNPLYGLAAHELREPDHKFEWSRIRFRSWGLRLARQYGYHARFAHIGEAHPELGSPTQAIRFSRIDEQGVNPA